ncbi:MAG: hypothetical protein NTX91_02420 [candidate division SR1 bacterium]|nr:hypothetical protein [candidate division SR1 bacterium]
MSLAFFAVLFRIVARIQLGDSFAVSIKTKKLITTGLYAKIAHPIYVFSLLALTGVLWSFARPIYFLALLPFLVLEVARARKEKQALLNVYGEKYKQHLKRVRF